MASSFSPEKARVPPAIELPIPSISKFKIGLCQLSVTADKERNIAHARQAIEEAAEKGAKLIVLPEIWNSPYSNDSFPVYAEDIDVGKDSSPSTAMLSEVARSLKITIVGGSIPERCGDKLYNTCCVFDTHGKLIAKHRKMHLFDVNIPGKITFEESKTLTAGETPTVVDTGWFAVSKVLILINMIKATVSSISHQILKPSTVSQWNYTIREAVNQAQYQNALFLFRQMMQKSLQPNHLTFPIIAKACGKLNNIHYSKIIHAQIVKSSFSSDIYVQTATMDMYIKCNHINIAHQVFDKMPKRDIASWNALLLGLAQLGLVSQVLSLFKQMRFERIQPDSVTVIGISQSIRNREYLWLMKAIHSFGIQIGVEVDVSVSNTWVSSYSKLRDLHSAEKVFLEIDSVFKTVITWNCIIAGYAYFKKSLKAISFYKDMLFNGFKPDLSTNLNLLSSIGHQESLFHGQLIHSHGIKLGFDLDISIKNTLISMYSKSGNLNAARFIFDGMITKTCVSWTAMIGGYAEKGNLDEALTLFHSMESNGIKPDLVTILNIISGCGETGNLEIGKWVENYAVLNGFKTNLMVLNALIDMYAKCGSIKEAREIFYTMHEKTVVTWTSMISGCALNGEFQESLMHFFHMLELGVKPNHITFLAVFQACNHGGFIKKGWEIYDLMTKVYKIEPKLDHYSCMIDLLGRNGKLNEAFDLIQKMPMNPDIGIWSSLLSACKIYKNVEIAEVAAWNLFEMDSKSAVPYVEMANIYASVGFWNGVMKVRRLMKRNQVVKNPGESVVHVNGKSYKFTVEDLCHPKRSVIYEVLDGLGLEMKNESDLSILQDVLVLP
ncbi:hypothetical protein L1887_02715 [Cichorium endivia]|nr:hypothetical protein L1887_02715 [Cichorium endivia]